MHSFPGDKSDLPFTTYGWQGLKMWISHTDNNRYHSCKVLVGQQAIPPTPHLQHCIWPFIKVIPLNLDRKQMLPLPSAAKARGGTADSEEQHVLGCWACSRASQTALGRRLCSAMHITQTENPQPLFCGTNWMIWEFDESSLKSRSVTVSSAATHRNAIAAKHRSAILESPLSYQAD